MAIWGSGRGVWKGRGPWPPSPLRGRRSRDGCGRAGFLSGVGSLPSCRHPRRQRGDRAGRLAPLPSRSARGLGTVKCLSFQRLLKLERETCPEWEKGPSGREAATAAHRLPCRLPAGSRPPLPGARGAPSPPRIMQALDTYRLVPGHPNCLI